MLRNKIYKMSFLKKIKDLRVLMRNGDEPIMYGQGGGRTIKMLENGAIIAPIRSFGDSEEEEL